MYKDIKSSYSVAMVPIIQILVIIFEVISGIYITCTGHERLLRSKLKSYRDLRNHWMASIFTNYAKIIINLIAISICLVFTLPIVNDFLDYDSGLAERVVKYGCPDEMVLSVFEGAKNQLGLKKFTAIGCFSCCIVLMVI
jgi:hypothetical protein